MESRFPLLVITLILDYLFLFVLLQYAFNCIVTAIHVSSSDLGGDLKCEPQSVKLYVLHVLSCV